MKEVHIFVSGKCLSCVPKKPGSYIVKLRYKDKVKYISGFVENTTANRIMLIGIIKAIELLKEPCNINIYIPCHIGIGKIFNKKGEYKTTSLKFNGDLLNELSKLLLNKGHTIKEHLDSEHLKKLKKYHSKYQVLYKKYNNKNTYSREVK